MPYSTNPEHLTKLEALRRQLRQTIHLFFAEGDPIAVHTLAAATEQALGDITAHRGLCGRLIDLERIKPEYRISFRQQLRAAQNFFKHGDKDPEGVLEFYPDATPFTILQAVHLYELVTGIAMPACQAYQAWFWMNHPDVLIEGPQKEFIITSVVADPGLASRAVALNILLSIESQ
jgi:hypothetical protein